MALAALKARFRVIHVYDLWVASVAALGLAATVRLAAGEAGGTLWWLAVADAVCFGTYFVAADAVDAALRAVARRGLVPGALRSAVRGVRERLAAWDAYGR